MMRGALLLAFAALPGAELRFHAPPGDPAASVVRALAEDGAANVTHFFGHRFPRAIDLTMVPARAAFDAAIPAKFGMTPTQCWMVGMGVADGMLLLSPSAWAKDACEHNAADRTELARLITHELTHVYHGQHNASGDFTGEDDLAWFIEGVAVLASGQLDGKRMDEIRAAAAAGKLPAKLDDVWTGKLRYAAAGSLARYVDARWGRPTTFRLLRARTTREALAMLRISEPALLAGWTASLT